MKKEKENKRHWICILFVVLISCILFSILLNRIRNKKNDIKEEPIKVETTVKAEPTTIETTTEGQTEERTTDISNKHEVLQEIQIKNFTDDDKKIFGKDYDYVYGYLISEVRAFYPNTKYLDYKGITSDESIVKTTEEKVYVFKAIVKDEVDRYFYLHDYGNGEYYIENM